MRSFAVADTDMDRMGAFDAVMWGVEQDPVLRSVVIAMIVLDDEPDFDVTTDRIERMTLNVPKLRQRVIGSGISLIPPRWETDPNFDLRFHLRRYQVQPDGTLRPALRVAEQLGEQDFDRDRPLWEIAIVNGFDGPRTAIIVKIHHSITDGVGGLAMAAALFDLTREPRVTRRPKPAPPAPNVLGSVGRLRHGVDYAARVTASRVREIAGASTGYAISAVTNPQGTANETVEFIASAGRLLAPASVPLSPIMVDRSLSQHYDVIELPLAELKAAGKSAGGTLNDAFMAGVSAGMAKYHEHHGSPCPALRVNMPVNMRSAGDMSAGNRWVPARFPLPTGDQDAEVRIRSLGPILKQARSEPALGLSDSVYRLLTALPQDVTTQISAGMMKGCDLACTNVPGPPIPIYAAGAKVLMIVPFAPKGGAAANIGLLSYDGRVFIGVNIDTRPVKDPEFFLQCLQDGFDEILALGGEGRAQAGFHSSLDDEE
jgi:diacylglycerol O-acyltransferase / wax synthase